LFRETVLHAVELHSDTKVEFRRSSRSFLHTPEGFTLSPTLRTACALRMHCVVDVAIGKPRELTRDVHH
jgi:hypothetical protein